MRTRFITLIFLLGFAPLSLFAGNGKRITKIVLDAGHGGKDIGARGKFSMEKDVALDIVLRIGRLIKENMPDVEVVYTRTTDEYPSLVDRHEIANKANADLFISVHINSTADRIERKVVGHKYVKRGRKKVRVPVYSVIRHHEGSRQGTETYVLGLHRNGQKEEAIGEYGETVSDEPGLLNEDDPQTGIIVAQYAQAFLSKSVALGTKIQQQFYNQGRPDYGVKQKGLEVLAGSAMPGVLVECGFINNPEEEEYMNSEKGQKEIANAIYKGIKAFKSDMEK
ncbi:MAG: hypothetical protein BGO69_10035 [Bacteroidetes bacterium 46-16]|nr:MAG: hypothetical protein BGO69_10035 [Bacteroidetes bacterium 46-16]